MNVVAFASADEFLKSVSEDATGCLVTDVRMPGMNGLEVLERIRRSRSMSELPVVLVAELTDPADAIEGLDRGGNDFVVKPFVTPLLAARIEAQLAAHRSARQVAALARQLEFRNAFIRQALGRSVPEDLLVELSERPDATKLGGGGWKTSNLNCATWLRSTKHQRMT